MKLSGPPGWSGAGKASMNESTAGFQLETTGWKTAPESAAGAGSGPAQSTRARTSMRVSKSMERVSVQLSCGPLAGL